jgi:hypothetical protein
MAAGPRETAKPPDRVGFAAGGPVTAVTRSGGTSFNNRRRGQGADTTGIETRGMAEMAKSTLEFIGTATTLLRLGPFTVLTDPSCTAVNAPTWARGSRPAGAPSRAVGRRTCRTWT